MELKDYLGEFSYPCVISTIKQNLLDCVVDTEEGKKMVDKIYQEINDSPTPILKLRNFIREIKPKNNEVGLSELNDCLETYVINNRDMNFIINVCKEEHIDNLTKNGIEYNDNIGCAVAADKFSLPSSDTIDLIRNGEYDGLCSDLLINVKRALGIIAPKEVEEPVNVFDANSYEDIRANIIGYLLTNPEADTIQGINLINTITSKIANSETTISDVKEFIDNSKQLTIADNRLINTVNFLEKLISNDNYNYLINVCREQQINAIISKGFKVSKDYYNSILDSEENIREDIISGKYDSLYPDSALFEWILEKLGIVRENYALKDKLDFLGKDCYVNIVKEIKENLAKAIPDTVSGCEIVNSTYNKLNESDNITPMLQIKEFITHAEKIAPDDTKLKEIIDFCKNKATTGDLNYIINVCKEEHFENLKRAGHPNPQKTISDIEKYFDQPSSVIEKAIKEGIFDKLNSKLLNDVKTGLNIKLVEQPEDGHNLMEGMNGYCEYNPIGVVCELPNNGLVILCESDVLSYNKEHEEFSKLNESIEIPNRHRRLMTAIEQTSYDPNKMEFTLNESWDFNLILDKEGKAFIGLNENSMKEIDKDSLRTLLLESVQTYEKQGVPTFNKQAYLHDADNFVCLMENYQNIVRIDNIKVIRNLNEGTYVMYDSNDVHSTNTPKLLSINGNPGKTFKSFVELNESIKNTLNFDCIKLFESEINDENNKLAEKQEKITSLMEQQKELNEKIGNVENLKRLADIDSPAMDRLNEQHNILNQMLQKNIDELNFYQNEFELH